MKKAPQFIAVILFVLGIAGAGVYLYQQYSSSQRAADIAASPQGPLPETLQPTAARLILRIDPAEERFSGTSIIDLQSTAASEIFWVHGAGLRIDESSFVLEDGTEIPLQAHEVANTGVLKLQASEVLPPRRMQLRLVYSAPFNHGLSGLYKVSDADLPYVFSQFEPIAARMAFPGFDEPRFKIPYRISLEVPQQLSAFSNTQQIAQQAIEGQWKRIDFATTRPLPSYLLAFAVGPLEILEGEAIPASAVRPQAIPLRGISTRGKAAKLRYALEHTAELVTLLEDYFQLPYPYDKLDLVAVPDFAPGAMENAGFITYREAVLLFDEKPSITQIRAFLAIHAHELSHQWFGNLVTMPWWNDIWLNESFATWMASKILNRWQPTLEFSRDIVQKGHTMMDFDVYSSSRKLRHPVAGREDIANAMDPIAYAKGGAILQMAEGLVSPRVFRQALQQHLRQHADGVADAKMFVQSIMTVSKRPEVAEVFDSFLNQSGSPLLHVDWQCSDEGLSLTMRQQRYLPLGSALDPDRQWSLPFCARLLGDNTSRMYCRTLHDKSTRIWLHQVECPRTIMPNTDGRGYFRWSLPENNWSTLLQHLHQLTAAERYVVASNLEAEFRAGRIDVSFYLQAVKQFSGLKDWDLITAPIDNLKFIAQHQTSKQNRQRLEAFARDLYSDAALRLGLKANTRADAARPAATMLLRQMLIGTLALHFDDKALTTQLAEAGKAYISYPGETSLNRSVIDPSLVMIALASAVKTEGDDYFSALKQAMLSSDDKVFRNSALQALAFSDKAAHSDDLLSMNTIKQLKLDEIPNVLIAHVQQPANRDRVFNWLQKHYALLERLLPDEYINKAPILLSGYCDRQARNRVADFFEPKVPGTAGLRDNLSNTLEQIDLCIALADKQLELPDSLSL